MIKFIYKIFIYSNLFLAYFLLIGCSSGDEDLRQFINEKKQRKGGKMPPVPEMVLMPKFIYPNDPNRRNPFKLRPLERSVDRLAPNIKRPKQPLEMYPLDSLKFVGVLKQDQVIWALIQKLGESGEIAKIKIGDYMGQNYGKVISITNQTLKLQELIRGNDKWRKQIISLNLTSQN